MPGGGLDGHNPGAGLSLDHVAELRVDPAEVEARADQIRAQSLAVAEDEASRLLLAVRLLDLTTLSDGDTASTVRRLCRDALRPVNDEVWAAHAGDDGGAPTVAAVCVFDRFVPVAVRALEGGPVRVAAVTAGFPRPAVPLERRLDQIRDAVAAGADEVDVVITRRHALDRDWEALYHEVRAMREAAGPALLKTILAAGALDTLDTVAKAGLVCCLAGASFIKTSTGREEVNATLPIGLAMAAAIRRYHALTGHAVGLKPAGGIRSAADALAWLGLVRAELGAEWLHASRFRIGASSLLDGIRTRLTVLAHREPPLRGST